MLPSKTRWLVRLTVAALLLPLGVHAEKIRPLEALGYRQAAAYLTGRLPAEAALEEMQRATRNYAKRQMTWFRRMGLDWLTPGEIDRAVKASSPPARGIGSW